MNEHTESDACLLWLGCSCLFDGSTKTQQCHQHIFLSFRSAFCEQNVLPQIRIMRCQWQVNRSLSHITWLCQLCVHNECLMYFWKRVTLIYVISQNNLNRSSWMRSGVIKSKTVAALCINNGLNHGKPGHFVSKDTDATGKRKMMWSCIRWM